MARGDERGEAKAMDRLLLLLQSIVTPKLNLVCSRARYLLLNNFNVDLNHLLYFVVTVVVSSSLLGGCGIFLFAGIRRAAGLVRFGWSSLQ